MSSLRESIREDDQPLNLNKPCVLVADDEPAMLDFLRSQLKAHFQVLEAVDGQQALDKAFQYLPDLILLDMMMPEKDGVQVCGELRSRTSTQQIPIILLTSRADEETKYAALSAGASDFLSKPFSTTELHVRVKNLVDSYGWQKRLARQNQILEATVQQLKETESQLVQAEKMAGLGRMSAGIIHEINNPLNYVGTGLYTLKQKRVLLPDDDKIDFDEILQDISEGIGRVKTIVSDLRTFTHPPTDQLDLVDLKKVITSSLRFLSNQFKNIQLETDLPSSLFVSGNSNKLVQVFVNLLQNGIDAMRTVPKGEARLRVVGKTEAGKVFVTLRDSGQGISSENLNKIFDPFFTTKEPGEGMGLGLSICFRIVSEYGGKIRVNSELGKFSEFTLEFPDKTTINPPATQPVNSRYARSI